MKMMTKIPDSDKHTMPMNVLPIEQLSLKRFPITKDQTLKAWNAADEYLLEQIHKNPIKPGEKILIINDQFGALSCSLSQYQPFYWTDSYLSKTAIQNNLKSNSLDGALKHVNQCDQTLPDNIKFDWVIIRIPKHNSLLSFQLKSLLPFIHSNTTILSAGMTKEIHKSNLKLFESIIGKTTTSLAKKKARLIFTTVEKKSENNFSGDLLKDSACQYNIKQFGLNIIGLPGVFSRDSLDIGSRVLLQHMPNTKAEQKLLDLGCGTGVLGTYAAKQNPHLEITFTDESWLAVESANQTFRENTTQSPLCKVTDVLDELLDDHYDHILCNPPFHQQNVQTLSIANRMFKESSKKLKGSGELRVVANRHLKYKPMLNQYFGQVQVISKDPKFVVWLAENPKR